MININAYRHQYGVGQGCFHVQTLELLSRDHPDITYRLVYDCGGSRFQKNKSLDWCVAHATAGAPPIEIDAVYLSHFEDDHVNGIEKLCKKAIVKRIYAPHIDANSAVHIIAQQMAAGATWTTSYQQFASTLLAIAGGGDVFGVPVIRVGGGERPPEGPELADSISPEFGDASEVTSAVVPNGQLIPHSMRIPLVVSTRPSGGGKDTYKVVWEMVHWYYGGDDLLTFQILAQIASVSGYASNCQPGLQVGATVAQVSASLLWMKQNRAAIAGAYIDTMDDHNIARQCMTPPKPAFPYNHNVASLCLYSGPIAAKESTRNTNSGTSCRMLGLRGLYWESERGGSWISTGDAMLGIADVWTEFLNHFGLARINACSTVLIPHHGADAAKSQNFTNQLIRANQFCVVSAGAHNIYGHPHRNIVKAILSKPALLQLVTESERMGFVEHLTFTF